LHEFGDLLLQLEVHVLIVQKTASKQTATREDVRKGDTGRKPNSKKALVTHGAIETARPTRTTTIGLQCRHGGFLRKARREREGALSPALLPEHEGKSRGDTLTSGSSAMPRKLVLAKFNNLRPSSSSTTADGELEIKDGHHQPKCPIAIADWRCSRA